MWLSKLSSDSTQEHLKRFLLKTIQLAGWERFNLFWDMEIIFNIRYRMLAIMRAQSTTNSVICFILSYFRVSELLMLIYFKSVLFVLFWFEMWEFDEFHIVSFTSAKGLPVNYDLIKWLNCHTYVNVHCI